MVIVVFVKRLVVSSQYDISVYLCFGDSDEKSIYNKRQEIKSIVANIRGGNSCRWVVFVSCQCTDRVNIHQPKPDTNNKRVNIR